jgi:intracellular sulfur oxidation DsrE/DsrF family protein
MKPAVATLAILIACAAAPVSSAFAADNRVVLQVSDNDSGKWNLALNNAKNLQNAYGKDNVDVEIVVYGPGINMLKADSLVGNRIEDAGKEGVKVVACENTMNAQKLTRNDMLNNIGYVKAGIVEIIDRQKTGWAYIRP